MNKQSRMVIAAIIALLLVTSGLIRHQGSMAPGDPSQLARGASGRFNPIPEPVGVKEPVTLTTQTAFTVARVMQQLTVYPSVPITVRPMGSHHYLIMPKSLWPANSRIRITWKSPSTSTVLQTGDAREVLINLTHQTLAAYQDNQPVRTMSVSTGSPSGWSTPTGTFWIYKRVRDEHMVGGDPNGPDHWDVKHVPYAQYFNDAVAIHGAWWNHRFGRPLSHGCVQLPTSESPHGPTGDPPEARWLWHFTDLGTPVIVVGHTPEQSKTPKTPLPYPPDSP